MKVPPWPVTTVRPETVLIVAPLGRDAEVMASALTGGGIMVEVCRDVSEVTRRVSDDAGVIVLTEEVLIPSARERLADAVQSQPPWSDVPIIVLTAMRRAAEPSAAVVQGFQQLGNVTLLERPIRVMTLISTVEVGLRARRRQYELQDHLAERQRRAEEAAAENRAKDEFLAMLGHELRNPLGALMSAARLLEADPPTSATGVRARGVVTRQLENLMRLVDDLLDISRVTKGTVRLNRRIVDFSKTVRDAVDALRARGVADRHLVTVQGRGVWVYADETRLEQIVANLVGNALKFTPPGGTVSVAVGPENGHAVLMVSDTGIGVPVEALPRIFDLFVQGEGGLDRSQGGLGIGLTLVRRLAELHGGAVEASSGGPGKGSTFTVRLPAVDAPAIAASDRAPVDVPTGRPRRVLIVEDNDDAREMLRISLTRDGHTVHEAIDGPSGFEAAVALQPDVALVDVGLPGLDGYELARRLRTDERANDIYLVALTGYGQPEDRRRAEAAGFDEHLVKPIDPQRLAPVLARASR
jgi:signal transduction histidine kinase